MHACTSLVSGLHAWTNSLILFKSLPFTLKLILNSFLLYKESLLLFSLLYFIHYFFNDAYFNIIFFYLFKNISVLFFYILELFFLALYFFSCLTNLFNLYTPSYLNIYFNCLIFFLINYFIHPYFRFN